MNHRAFTLIELLVVVAIIGILAAVGVVAYNGYTGAAKVNAVETNIKSIEKYIVQEVTKCELGETNTMNGNFSCGGSRKAQNIASATVKAFCGSQSSYSCTEFKNPYNSKTQVTSGNYISGDDDVGYIRISTGNKGGNDLVRIMACVKTPCSNYLNQKEIFLDLED